MNAPFFPDECWLEKKLAITHPSPSVWKLTEKVKEYPRLSSTYRMQQEHCEGNSIAYAIFNCRNAENPPRKRSPRKGQMMIMMQLPPAESLFLPASVRRKYASDVVCGGFVDTIEAYRRLSAHNCEFTPKFIGYSHEKQDDDGFVPGGYFSYYAYTPVPGVCLGDNITDTVKTSEIPGGETWKQSYHNEGAMGRSTVPRGVFWSLSTEKRAEIRAKFETIHKAFRDAGVDVHWAYLDKLKWDKAKKKLYIDAVYDTNVSAPFVLRDGRYRHRETETYAQALTRWWLALPPPKYDGTQRYHTISDLTESGWLF
ncbi:hypothetical protein FE257_005857 [Aspergillus nanangensis]|uniref:Uncharacterized protein n=1 Tax=Aspergillus nanangensis TaxID=2582783 RepID=A0AAD4CQ83_ASPNN|nr:hypothetical protein FE257_005857 [Aspergillus nanangensis]